MSKKHKDRELEQEPAAAEAPPPELTADPNAHSPNAASGEQHHCGIDAYLAAQADAAGKTEPEAEEPARKVLDESELEELTPDQLPADGEPPRPESPPRRRKIWDNF